uniref:DUF5641 domain-containing protein n=1 Tax=Caenorhabditis japonica TaxID=281687 RepID=A0A8R1E503_CAEJA
MTKSRKVTPAEGDVVLIHKEHLSRHHWPLDLISAIEKGEDVEDRSAVVKARGKEYKRCVSQLITLEIQERIGDDSEDVNFKSHPPQWSLPQKRGPYPLELICPVRPRVKNGSSHGTVAPIPLPRECQ